MSNKHVAPFVLLVLVCTGISAEHQASGASYVSASKASASKADALAALRQSQTRSDRATRPPSALAALLLAFNGVRPALGRGQHSLISSTSPGHLHYQHPSPILRARRSSANMLDPSGIIDLGVKLDTFAPQFLWLAMIVAPRSELTSKVMGPIGPIIGLSMVHLVIVLLAATKPGGIEPILIFIDVFRPDLSQLDGMQRLFAVRDFVAEEWPHVLIWDLFVGRAIWLDGIERNVPFLAPSLALCNFIGPPGLLLYALTCSLTGVGLPPLGYRGEQQDDK